MGLECSFEHLPDVDGWVFAFPVTFKVYRNLKLLAGPGFELESRRPESGTDNLFLFRIGAQYGFEIRERYSIVPAIELDWIDEEEGVAKAVILR